MTTREREELLAAIFVDVRGEPAARCRAWMLDEPRFATFAQSHREKIGKKARNASGVEGLRDLLAELEVSHQLLRERRFDLTYEAYAAAKAGGPDFTITYKGHITFNVEVKRLRAGAQSPAPAVVALRLVDAVCAKLRQMPPSSANVLAVVAEHAPDQVELAAMMRRLVARAERADATLFARHGFADTRDFFAGFRRLSAVWMQHSSGDSGAALAALWQNPQARHPLQADLPALLTRDRVGSG